MNATGWPKTGQQVATVRRLYASGRHSMLTIAQRTGISRFTVGKIIRGVHPYGHLGNISRGRGRHQYPC